MAEDQLNVLSRSFRPLVDGACETCDVPCCYPENKSYHRNLMHPREEHHPELVFITDVIQLFAQIVLVREQRLAPGS